MRITFALALCFLTGCQTGLTPSAGIDGPKVARIAPSLKVACMRPADIPAGADARQIAGVISHDRSALGECRRRHGALVNAATVLENQFRADE